MARVYGLNQSFRLELVVAEFIADFGISSFADTKGMVVVNRRSRPLLFLFGDKPAEFVRFQTRLKRRQRTIIQQIISYNYQTLASYAFMPVIRTSENEIKMCLVKTRLWLFLVIFGNFRGYFVGYYFK